MHSKRVLWCLPVVLSVIVFSATCALADIASDVTLTSVDDVENERVESLKAYVKSNKVKLEWQSDLMSFVLRSDLQHILHIYPSQATYAETDFGELYTTPFGPNPLVIAPGFGEPTVESIDTGQTELIDGFTCKKYVINEISSFRLLQYTIYATEELASSENFASFFASETPLKYKPFEEMRRIPGMPLKISISETIDGSSFSQTYKFSNYQETSLEESLFNLPEGYTLK